MKDRIERFVVLPFSLGCSTQSSVAVAASHQHKKPNQLIESTYLTFFPHDLVFSFLFLFLFSDSFSFVIFGFIRKRRKWLVSKRRDKDREQWCQYLGWYLQTCSKLKEFFSLLHKYVLFYYYLLLFSEQTFRIN